jgi:hypothetical protein
MLIALRIVALLGLGSVAACAIAWLLTRERVWLQRALLALKIAVGLAIFFFVVVIAERLWETAPS